MRDRLDRALDRYPDYPPGCRTEDCDGPRDEPGKSDDSEEDDMELHDLDR
jgi:hypothetical protein